MIKHSRVFSTIETFFQSWRFPAFSLAMLCFFILFITLTLVVPESSGSVGKFFEEFRVLCFGYNPDTATFDWGTFSIFLFEPIVLSGVIYLLWGTALLAVLRTAPRLVLPYAGVGVALSFLLILGLTLGKQGTGTDVAVFPADDIRTNYPAPVFTLTDHNRKQISPKLFKGQVVLITAFFTRCGYTCPLILGELKRLVAELSAGEKEKLKILAITLDPQYDTPEILKQTATHSGLNLAQFHFLTGAEKEVDAVHTALGVFKTADEQLGVNHSNIFVLIDKEERVAYRLALGKAEKAWLIPAIQHLIAEKE